MSRSGVGIEEESKGVPVDESGIKTIQNSRSRDIIPTQKSIK